MSSKGAIRSGQIAAGIAAIAVTVLLHGGWLANVNGPARVPVIITA